MSQTGITAAVVSLAAPCAAVGGVVEAALMALFDRLRLRLGPDDQQERSSCRGRRGGGLGGGGGGCTGGGAQSLMAAIAAGRRKAKECVRLKCSSVPLTARHYGSSHRF